MLQVKTFLLPMEEEKANQLMETVKVTNTSFNKDMIVVFHDDGIKTDAERLADLQEMLASIRAAQFQQEVALHMLKHDRANAKPGSDAFAEFDHGCIKTQQAIDDQDVKAEFVLGKIAELQAKLPKLNG